MNHTKILLLLCLGIPFFTYSSSIKNKILNKKQPQEVKRHEYPMAANGTVTLDNIHGNVHVKPEWSQQTVVVSAIKKAPSQEILSTFRVIGEQHSPNHVTIRTGYDAKIAQGSIDYELIVPRHTKLKLTTFQGNITVDTVSGDVEASTTHGTLVFKNVAGVKAEAKETGSIIISYADGNIAATTQKGNITIVESRKHIKAFTEKGSIDLFYQQPPAQNKLQLTASGNISVHMPAKTNAFIKAETEKGKVLCQHPLTIQPHTTTLDDKAYAGFKRKVHAVMGSKNNANEVSMYATNGSIKILEATALPTIAELTA